MCAHSDAAVVGMVFSRYTQGQLMGRAEPGANYLDFHRVAGTCAQQEALYADRRDFRQAHRRRARMHAFTRAVVISNLAWWWTNGRGVEAYVTNGAD
jgi:hypothetical protein